MPVLRGRSAGGSPSSTAAHAGDEATAAAFATDAIFHAIRLEPYLLATAERHKDLAPVLTGLAEVTAGRRETLVHGDVSPKNILVGPKGPVFLDAECAWYGDPAFDIAFCLNHMLLKSVWKPRHEPAYIACFRALVEGYGPDAGLDGRAARLLPGLLLARIDGKSPVEYLAREDEKARPRAFARRLLQRPPASLAESRGGLGGGGMMRRLFAPPAVSCKAMTMAAGPG